MATANNDNLWIQLAMFPEFIQWHFLCLTKINTNNILAVADGYVYNYNLQTNKWSLIKHIEVIDGGDQYIDAFGYAAALYNNQLLYLSDPNTSLMTINVVDKTVNKLYVSTARDSNHIGCYSTGFMINNEYHIIGGEYNNKHLKWNSKSNEWEIMYTFSEFEQLAVNPVVFLKSKQKLFMFGGYQCNYSKYFDTIYEYNIQQNIWNKMSIKMPKACCVGIAVPVIREQFILFFGWYNFDDCDQDDIFIFSVSQQTFRKSLVKCPAKRIYSGIAINDYERDEKIVFGYVRKHWKLSQISDHWFPPLYLLQLMAKYFLTEYVHILDETGIITNHWKISSLDIV